MRYAIGRSCASRPTSIGTRPSKLPGCGSSPTAAGRVLLGTVSLWRDTGRAMSQENVEIVRRGWEAWVRGDLDALLELCDPAVEWDTTHMEGWLGSWERFESGAEKILEAGGDRVVVICWQQGFGPGSEVPVHMNWAQICTLQRGLVCR